MFHHSHTDIMRVISNENYREPYFSSPAITVHNNLLGIPVTNDASGMIADNHCIVANFRPDEYLPFTCTLTGQSAANTGATVSLTVTPINGISPYTYAWWTSTDGGSTWSFYTTTYNSGTSTVNFTMPNASGFMVRVLATSSFSETTEAFKLISNPGLGQICCQNTFRAAPGIESQQAIKGKENFLEIAPNPSTDHVSISWSLGTSKLKGDERILITDMLGKVVYEKPVLSAKFTHQIRLNNFSAGSYIVNLITASGSKTQKLTVIK